MNTGEGPSKQVYELSELEDTVKIIKHLCQHFVDMDLLFHLSEKAPGPCQSLPALPRLGRTA